MVSWIDGVEYAPTQRPFGFAMPRAAPLPTAEPAPSLAEGQPAEAPGEFRQAPGANPLESLAPRTGPRRDPHRSFGVDQTALTSSAWGSAHSSATTRSARFDPTAAMAPSGLATGAGLLEHSEAALAPPVGDPVATWPVPREYAQPEGGVNVGELVTMVGIPVLICLGVGMVIWQLAFPLLVVALALVSARPESPINQPLRATLGGLAAGALAMTFLWNVMEDSLFSLGRYSQFGCLVGLVTAGWLAWRVLPKVQ